ncbi:hypothetical protein QQ045_021505 [Rhodiola kirilowii]
MAAVAVAIDGGKTSKAALKWTVDNIFNRNHPIILVYVRCNAGADMNNTISMANNQKLDTDTKELFRSFLGYCKRKNVNCTTVVLDATNQSDIPKALIEYAKTAVLDILVVGSSGKSGFLRSPFNRQGVSAYKSNAESDISFVNHAKPDYKFPENFKSQFSASSDDSYSSSSGGSSLASLSSWSSGSQSTPDELETEMRRLMLELKHTKEMYSAAVKEVHFAKHANVENPDWRFEQRRLQRTQQSEEDARALAEKERERYKAALEAAATSRRIAELEAQKRKEIEMKGLVEESLKGLTEQRIFRYQKYSYEAIEKATEHFSESNKIGEGGYGPVYKGYLDHTPVAIKILKADAAEGQSQFQQEVEVLSCIRHPNMVLLLGACPERGTLVYEYMEKGSLEDCLFRRGNTPVLPWQLRFRIAAEITTGLLFLHHAKPEPLVHRDLKPGNILLNRNYVAKISDVGLARLVPQSVANQVTQYRMTSAAGTFCYIDPEYQQTCMLSTKSDVYSLGIMLLQIITAKPPMGLAHRVEMAIEEDTFPSILDPSVPNWPIDAALMFAKISLKCAELRRRDRPALDEVLPILNALRDLGEQNMSDFIS